MKIKNLTAGLLLAVMFAWTGNAHAFSTGFGDILILDGLPIDGANPIVFVFDKTAPSLAVEIKWDFVYEAGGDSAASWGSELGFTVVAPDGTQWTFGSAASGITPWCNPCDVDFGFTDDPGIFVSGGSLDITGNYGLGFWEIVIGEGFDDAGIDGRFLSGVIGINKVPVPVPAALWLFGSGLMGLGLLRRRSA